MPGTVYITDLDGTLLHSDKRISERSAEILNSLIENGVTISVASARSLIGISMINLSAVHFKVPLILMNGVLLYDFESQQIVDSCRWEEKTASDVLTVCKAGGKTPFLYCVQNGKLDISFENVSSEGEKKFVKDRVPIFPDCFHQVQHYTVKDAIYYSMQDSYTILKPIQDKLSVLDDVESVLYQDTYLKNNWYLEIFSDRAGKGNGTARLRRRLQANCVVAFGDNMNDLPLFEAADVTCAVKNAAPEVKKAADYIIRSNDEDGVAEYIYHDFYFRNQV